MEKKKILIIGAITFGFKKIYEHIRLLFLPSLLWVVGTLVAFGIVSILFNKFDVFSREQCSLFAYYISMYREFFLAYYFILCLPFFVFACLIFVLLDFGFKAIALNICDNNTSRVGVLFSQSDKLLKGCIAYGLFFLMVCCGFLLFIVPGVIVLVRCYFFAFFIVDKNVGAIESLKMSYGATKGYFWSIFDFIWAFKIINTFGYVFTWPSTTLAAAHVYRQICPADE